MAELVALAAEAVDAAEDCDEAPSVTGVGVTAVVEREADPLCADGEEPDPHAAALNARTARTAAATAVAA